MKVRGFTLIELLIAVSIFAVVAIALYSTFFGGISVWKRSGAGGSIYHDVKFTFNDMARDIKNAVHMSEDEESMFVFFGAGDEISFMTLVPASSENDVAQELVKVEYRFDKDAGQLTRAQADLSAGFDVEGADKEILLEGVEGFTLEYCYDSGDEDDPYVWEEEWDDKEMRIPRGVKVTSILKAEADGNEALEFTEIIFVPTGVLGEEEVGL